MKIYYVFLMCLLVFGGSSCWNREFRSHQLIEDGTSCEIIDVSEVLKSDSPGIANIIDSIIIIPLETSINSIIGNEIPCCVTQSRIYIKANRRRFTIFDINGKFIKALEIGSGTGEIMPNEMFFNQGEKCFYVYDDSNGKINKYSEDGEYITQYYTNTLCEGFMVHNGKFIMAQPSMISRNGHFNILSCDTTSFDSGDSWDLGEEVVKNLGHEQIFHPYDGGFFIEKSADNNIYYMNGDTLSKKYYIKNDNEPVDKNIYSFDSNTEEHDEKFLYSGIFYETDDFFCFRFDSRRNIRYVFRNKHSKQLFSMDMGPGLMRYVCVATQRQYSGNWFVGMIITDMFFHRRPKDWDAPEYNPLISPEDMEKLRNVKPDDNPIIVLFKLKDEI